MNNKINNIFNERKDDNKYNNSYTVKFNTLNRYEDEINYCESKIISFYIHIPFNENNLPSEEFQHKYIDSLEHDIQHFMIYNGHLTLNGFDIGGNSPTALCDACFKRLIDLYKNIIQYVDLTEDFEPSIQASFNSINKYKLRLLRLAKISRISLDIEQIDYTEKRGIKMNRTVKRMEKKMKLLRDSGTKNINLNISYGNDLETTKKDIEIINILRPTQITLYELRTKLIDNVEISLTKTELYDAYNLIFNELKNQTNQYCNVFGCNILIRNSKNVGLSSYQKNKIQNFTDYKGFGFSAESKINKGISYNLGKKSNDVSKLLYRNSYHYESAYYMSNNELASKFIAASAKSGEINIKVINKYFDFKEYFKNEIKFCVDNEYIDIDNYYMKITKKGFKYYNAIFSLFYKQNKL